MQNSGEQIRCIMGNLVVAYTELGLPVVSSYFNELGHLACVADVEKGMGEFGRTREKVPFLSPSRAQIPPSPSLLTPATQAIRHLTHVYLFLEKTMFSLWVLLSEPPSLSHSGAPAPNENIVQNHLNIALLNVF